MLRGWNTASFAQPKLPITAALIVVGGLMAHHNVDAAPLSDHVFEAEVLESRYRAANRPFEAFATYKRDGRVVIDSALGRFEGEWERAGSTICMFFDTGPRVGTICGEVQRFADGRLKTSTGTILVPVHEASDR